MVSSANFLRPRNKATQSYPSSRRVRRAWSFRVLARRNRGKALERLEPKAAERVSAQAALFPQSNPRKCR